MISATGYWYRRTCCISEPEHFLKASVVREAGELVGDGLAAHLKWGSTFSSANVAWVASDRSSSRSPSVNRGRRQATVDHSVRASPVLHRTERSRHHRDLIGDHVTEGPADQRHSFGFVDWRAEPLERALPRGLDKHLITAGPDAKPAAAALQGIDRRLACQLEQGLAVKIGRNRLPDAADRFAQPTRSSDISPSRLASCPDLLLNSWPRAANSSWPEVWIGQEKSPPASLLAAARKRPSCACSARDASSEKHKARSRNAAMKATATARLEPVDASVADRSDSTVTSTGAAT
jgi:hypothetical protein